VSSLSVKQGGLVLREDHSRAIVVGSLVESHSGVDLVGFACGYQILTGLVCNLIIFCLRKIKDSLEKFRRCSDGTVKLSAIIELAISCFKFTSITGHLWQFIL
jgi:hypothetical protein